MCLLVLWIRTRVVLLPMSLSNWLLLSESTAVEPAVLIPFLFRREKQQCNVYVRRVYDICNETLVCVSRARCLQCSNDYNKIKTTSLFFHVYNFQCYALCCAERMCMRVCEYDRERKTLTLHQLDEKKKKYPHLPKDSHTHAHTHTVPSSTVMFNRCCCFCSKFYHRALSLSLSMSSVCVYRIILVDPFSYSIHNTNVIVCSCNGIR